MEPIGNSVSRPPSWPEHVFIWSAALFFVCAAHYLQLNRSGVGLELPFNAAGWIPVSFCIGAGLYVIASREAFWYTDLTIGMTILVCLLILPFFMPAADQDSSMDRMLGLLGGLLFFISIQQFRLNEEKRILIMLMVIAAVWVELIIGWDRFLRSVGIGISDSRPAWTGPPHGIFQQRNVFASFIATGIVLSGYLLGYCSKIFQGRFQPYYLVLLLLPLAGIHLLNAMYSRTGWLGAGLGVLLVAPFLWKNAPKLLAAGWALSIVAGYILTGLLEQSASWGAPARELLSVEGLRQIHFPQTVRMILAKPLLGYGYGTFEHSYLYYMAEEYASGKSAIPGVSRLDHPHNELLFWAAEGGLYALFLLLAAAWLVWKRITFLQVRHRFALVGLFFPIILHTQVEYPFYQSLLHFMVFIVFIYWADRLTAEERCLPVKSTLLAGISSMLVPLLTTTFMLTTLQAGYLFARYDSGTDPNVASLTRVVNPAAYSDRINWAIMSRLVLSAALNNKPEQAGPFIDWAPDLLNRKPRPDFYRFMILAEKVVGDEDNMKKWQDEARYLFPDETFETPDLDAGVASPVPFDAISR